ncbi:MAG: hypothetical protein KJ757_02395 [Planctomycetes bacterium]|nr:hypothetical protein [Planctomycetota bacterium]MBU1517762.1 hypothetical protein [Planctomycetota bacterium]MBU2458383.1 hypothetical protein [Planctomycetota bacterium]MBU2596401.1 hypothetical protein [Planctomycetota bacterium]
MSLTKEQLQIIDELFESGGDESTVLQKHNISFKTWQQQLADKDFADEIAARMESSKRQGQIILSKYVPFAAAKLVQLCESENQETSRKAVLDILNLQTGLKTNEPVLPEIPALDPATASKLLAALAEENSKL